MYLSSIVNLTFSTSIFIAVNWQSSILIKSIHLKSIYLILLVLFKFACKSLSFAHFFENVLSPLRAILLVFVFALVL